MNMWNAGKAVLGKLDARSLHYPWMGLGQNSNSVASTLIAAMGRSEPPVPGGAFVMPGAGSMLLDPKDIQDIQRKFNIGALRSGDAPNAGEHPDEVGQPSPLAARWPFGPVGAPSGPAAAALPQGLRGKAVPRAAGPTSLGGPDGPAPLEPPVRSRAPARSAPTVDPALPPPSFGAPRVSPPVPAPADLGEIGSVGNGNGAGDWKNSIAPGAGRTIPLFEDRWNALGQGSQSASPGNAGSASGGYRPPSASQLMFDPGSLRAPAQSLRASPGSAGSTPPEEVRRLTRVNTLNSDNALASGNAATSVSDGMFANEPSHSIQFPIWGFENRGDGRNEAEQWFARWIRPLLRQE